MILIEEVFWSFNCLALRSIGPYSRMTRGVLRRNFIYLFEGPMNGRVESLELSSRVTLIDC